MTLLGEFIRTEPTNKGVAVKRFAPILLLFAACSPDIQKDPPSSGNAIVAQFDPSAPVPVAPQPNDLVRDPTTGKIAVPASPADSPAQAEFNRDYLGNLTGFPFESTAQVTVSDDLAPTSVNARSVLVFDITSTPMPVAVTPEVVGRSIVVPPPNGAWTRAHRYAVAVIGGQNGVRGANNENVIGSQTWYLVSGTKPLVSCDGVENTCTDLASLTVPTCRPAVDIIPSTETDPAARLADQTKSAIQLEQVRCGYDPLLNALQQMGVARQDVPILWTFTIVDAGEMTFDPANGVIPFPNDILLSNGKVNLPNPKTGVPLTQADCQSSDSTTLLYCGLNTLDGFSTIAPLISENSDTLGAALQATIKPESLTTQSVGLAAVASNAPATEQTQPNFTPCLNCMSSPDASGNVPSSPQQLQWKLNAPLDEKTTYFAYVTSGVTDDGGKPVIASATMALVRLSHPLVDENGKSTVNIVSDEQAAQLEPLRAALKPAFDSLDAAGLPRANVALAFPFTTQSEASVLDQLYAYPSQIQGLPDSPFGVADATDAFPAVPGVDKIFVGTFLTPVAITSPSGTLDPANPQILPVNFLVAVPSMDLPANGYPVTIFGHGLGRSHNDAIAIASAIAAKGQVVIAADWIFHGDRTSCTDLKSATGLPTDDAACADPTTMKCDEGTPVGLCVLRDDASRADCTPGPEGNVACIMSGQGSCAADSKCQGAGADLARDATGLPSLGDKSISGWNMFSLTNFFATRDNFRQPVIDFAQLLRVIKSQSDTSLVAQLSLKNGEAIALDTSNINYVGQSLGGILGTNVNAVSPDTNNVVLDVPGGDLPQIILTAPSFAPQREELIATLAKQDINPGTPAFDQFTGIVQWILDPADPANMGYRLTHGSPNANRKAFIQFIEGDETVPNVSNFALVTGANRNFVDTPPSFGCMQPLSCYEFTEAGDSFDATTAALGTRHGFLLSPPTGAAGAGLTVKAQTQVANFIATGSL
ncbi:MAG: hypothetical protein FWD69_06020 [Polyangiaceae bacterium]|nr:hypothetical protein [Polyangiaceae bacterium]